MKDFFKIVTTYSNRLWHSLNDLCFLALKIQSQNIVHLVLILNTFFICLISETDFHFLSVTMLLSHISQSLFSFLLASSRHFGKSSFSLLPFVYSIIPSSRMSHIFHSSFLNSADIQHLIPGLIKQTLCQCFFFLSSFYSLFLPN